MTAGSVHLSVVRHGETEANALGRYMGHGDSPLTPIGLAQVDAVAVRIAKRPPDAIFASDLLRAARTAEVIGAACGVSVQVDARLRERHVGLLQGMTDDEARAGHPDVFRELDRVASDYVVPGGESADAVRARVAAFVDDVMKEPPGQRVLVVAHGGVARGLLWHLLDIPFRASRWACCDNTSLSTFRRKHGMWILERWNDTAHLA